MYLKQWAVSITCFSHSSIHVECLHEFHLSPSLSLSPPSSSLSLSLVGLHLNWFEALPFIDIFGVLRLEVPPLACKMSPVRVETGMRTSLHAHVHFCGISVCLVSTDSFRIKNIKIQDTCDMHVGSCCSKINTSIHTANFWAVSPVLLSYGIIRLERLLDTSISMELWWRACQSRIVISQVELSNYDSHWTFCYEGWDPGGNAQRGSLTLIALPTISLIK